MVVALAELGHDSPLPPLASGALRVSGPVVRVGSGRDRRLVIEDPSPRPGCRCAAGVTPIPIAVFLIDPVLRIALLDLRLIRCHTTPGIRARPQRQAAYVFLTDITDITDIVDEDGRTASDDVVGVQVVDGEVVDLLRGGALRDGGDLNVGAGRGA